MVELEQIKVVLQGLTTIAALIKLRREARESGREPTALEIEGASRVEPSLNGFDVLHAQITQSTLDAIGAVIERARRRFDDALRDPANPKSVRDSEEDAVRFTICGELHRIRRLNDGALPTEYEQLWREFACV